MRSSPAFLLAFLLIPHAASTGAVVTVDTNGTGDFAEIQPTIDAAAAGDTIVVLPGEYVITAPITFGDEAFTVASEKGAAETTIRMAVPEDPDRASVVIFERSESTLDGFTLTEGIGTLLGKGGDGDMFQAGTSSVRSCGAIACLESSAPTIRNCVISGNSALRGGGVFCQPGTTPTLVGCTITRNRAADGGGGLYSRNASPTLVECTILENVAQHDGGGVVIEATSAELGLAATITNCTISRNHALDDGDGIWNARSTLTLTGCTISENAATGLGGGIEGGALGPLTLTNCVFSGKLATFGGAIYYGAPVIMTNCTVVANSAADGAGVRVPRCRLTMRNCIAWGNYGESIQCDGFNPRETRVSDSCLDPDQPLRGSRLIYADPRFKNFDIDGLYYDFGGFMTVDIDGVPVVVSDFLFEAPDFRLRRDSPCVDKGILEGAPEVDIEGNARPCRAGVDIGAFERGDCFPEPVTFLRGDCDGDGQVGGRTTDAVVPLRFAFLAADEPPCLASCDAEANGTIGVGDAVRILRFSFLAQAPPDPPFPECGASELPSDSVLGCDNLPENCQ